MVLFFIFRNVTIVFAVWQTGSFRKMPHSDKMIFHCTVSSFSASCVTQIKSYRHVIVNDVFTDKDKLYSVTHLWKLPIAWDIHHPAPSPLSSPPTCSLTLCAARRLWTKPISVRYFIPDATPVSKSISCITLNWPSCFWGYGRPKERKTGDGKWEKGKKNR